MCHTYILAASYLALNWNNPFQYLSHIWAGAETDLNARLLLTSRCNGSIVEELGLDPGDAIAIAEALQQIDEHSPLRARKVRNCLFHI